MLYYILNKFMNIYNIVYLKCQQEKPIDINKKSDRCNSCGRNNLNGRSCYFKK